MQMQEKAFAKILIPSKQQISTKSMQMQETEFAINNKIEHLKDKCRKETRVKQKKTKTKKKERKWQTYLCVHWLRRAS